MVTKLKAETDGRLEVAGATLAAPIVQAGLVDEYRIVVTPTAVGGGTHTRPGELRMHYQVHDSSGTRYPGNPLVAQLNRHQNLGAMTSQRIGSDKECGAGHHTADQESNDRKAHHLADIELRNCKQGQQPKRLNHVSDALTDRNRHRD